MRPFAVLAYFLLLLFFLSSCATAPKPRSPLSVPERTLEQKSSATPPASPSASLLNEGTSPPRTAESEIWPGTGSFVADGEGAEGNRVVPEAQGRFTLNFKSADVREVVRAVMGDLLRLNYTLDERVKGQVSLETRRPLARDEVLPMLETVLRAHGFSILKAGELYRVVPASTGGAAGVPLGVRGDGARAGRGYQHLIVPLRYIGARAIEAILRPLSPANGLVLADARRNILVLAGTQAELAQMERVVDTFDVDQLAGMSVGLFRLAAADVKTVQRELELILGENAEAAAMLRLVPIERLNGLLAITPQPEYLKRVEDWVRRLDRADAGASAGLHVYYVQNARATHLAEVLGPLFGAAPRSDAFAEVSLAPGQRPVVIDGDKANPVDNLKQRATTTTTSTSNSIQGKPAIRTGELAAGPVTIIADDKRNALIVKASGPDYARIEQVIRKLDTWPMQVLVEATIIDVALGDQLSLGVEWLLKGRFDGKRAEARLDLGAPGIAPLVPGFSYTVLDNASNVRAVLNALAAESRLKVVSSPTMMVLDNHKATIRVGDQVPVRTSEAAGLGTSAVAPVIASTFDYRDTGVLLEVVPRVNASGMVTLEIHQEVNDVVPTTTSGIDSPTINQRRFTTTVAVQDGETVVLGGLIRDRADGRESGVPLLSDIPVLGWLFKSRTDIAERSELIVVITPTAVRDPGEARAATEELRRRMSEIQLPPWLQR